MAKEIYYWEADDGTQFPTEDECVFYETTQKAKRLDGQFKLFDKDGDEVPFHNADPDETYGIIIKTQEAADFLGEWFGSAYWKPWCYANEAKPGNYIFYSEDWWTEEELKEHIEEKLKIFREKG